MDADVIVVGAGMAGLTAARALCERGLRVIVLEAQERVGGRILSRTVEGGQVVELGAEFVHGRPPELWALIEEAGLDVVEREGAMLRETEDGRVEEDADARGEMFEPLEKLVDWQGEDVSFAEWISGEDLEPWQKESLTGYVEGFNAADARVIGVRGLGAQQKAEDATEGDRAWHVRGGYALLPEFLASRVKELGGEVRLACEVLAIRWRAGEVEVETNRCGVLHVPKCVVTLPLSLLQKVNDEGGVRMSPEPAAVAAARRMAMGEVVRFSMVFREAWWAASPVVQPEEAERMSFLFTLEGTPSVWWTQRPEADNFPVLTGWAGGPRSRALAGRSAAELGREACARLARVFRVAEEQVRAELVATYTHDWQGDAHACGAYSYVLAGAMEAPQAMTQAEQDTLFFAGEHTDVTAHWGTVHAAMRSGLRAAAQVLGESAS